MINFAYAQTSAQQPSMFASFIPLILIFLIFYFLLIRPQQKKQKEHRLLLDAIKRGDVKAHSRSMIILFWSGLIIAGGFTLFPGRYLNELLF